MTFRLFLRYLFETPFLIVILLMAFTLFRKFVSDKSLKSYKPHYILLTYYYPNIKVYLFRNSTSDMFLRTESLLSNWYWHETLLTSAFLLRKHATISKIYYYYHSSDYSKLTDNNVFLHIFDTITKEKVMLIPFSELTHSASKLLHTYDRIPTPMTTDLLSS